MEKKVGRTEYDNSIQGLRGLAIILIIVSHMFGRFNSLGGFGTAVFVAISGFVACKKCRSSESGLSVRQMIYRIAKLYPLYLLVTCITAVYFNPEIVYGVSRKESIVAFVFNVLMIQTYVPKSSFFGAFSQVGWYMPFVVLSILCSNLIYKLWRKLDIKLSLGLIGIFGILEFAVIASGWGSANWLIYFSPVFRLFEFVLGGCVYIIADEAAKDDKSKVVGVLVSIVAMTAVMAILSTRLSIHFDKKLYMRMLWWYIPTWYILAFNYRFNIVSRIFENRLFVFIGNISFELFLTHLMVIKGVEVLASGMNLTNSIVKIISAILIIGLGYIINMLDNIWKSKAYYLICQKPADEGTK